MDWRVSMGCNPEESALATNLECRSLLLGPCTPGTIMHNTYNHPHRRGILNREWDRNLITVKYLSIHTLDVSFSASRHQRIMQSPSIPSSISTSTGGGCSHWYPQLSTAIKVAQTSKSHTQLKTNPPNSIASRLEKGNKKQPVLTDLLVFESGFVLSGNVGLQSHW